MEYIESFRCVGYHEDRLKCGSVMAKTKYVFLVNFDPNGIAKMAHITNVSGDTGLVLVESRPYAVFRHK